MVAAIFHNKAADFVPAEVFTKLQRLAMAGCTCMTKTPELQYHNARCTYRIASEIADLLNTAPVPAWQVLTPELLRRIETDDDMPRQFWLWWPGFSSGPVVGQYEWQQGHEPYGFNTEGYGRVYASQVTHVMPFNPPAPPSA